MKNFFSMDKPLFRILSTLYDLIILNLLTILCCLPVLTTGASLTALHFVLIEIVRGEETYIVRSFFRSFRENLRQCTLIWSACLLLCAAGFWLVQSSRESPFRTVISGCVGLMAIALFLLSLYLFPFVAHFRNTIGQSVRISAALTSAYLFRTLGMAAIHIVFAALLWGFIRWTIPLIVLFGLSLPAYFCALLYHPVLVRLEKRTDSET